MLKRCSLCDAEKPATDFYRRTVKGVVRLQARCKPCFNGYSRAKALGPEKSRARTLARRAEKLKTCVRCGDAHAMSEYDSAPSGQMFKRCRSCRLQVGHDRPGGMPTAFYKSAEYKRLVRASEPPEKVEARREKQRRNTRRYLQANPQKARIWGEQRQARAAAQADGSLSASTVDRIYASRKTCPYCLCRLHPLRTDLDHIIPLSKGGVHGAVNLVPCCSECNRRKRAMNFIDWVATLSAKGQTSAKRLFSGRFGPVEQALLPL